MKVKKVIQPKLTEEIEIEVPCFRKRENKIAMFIEEGHIEIKTDGSYYAKYSLAGNEYFDEKSQKSTKEKFLSAITKHLDYISQNSPKT